VAIAEIEAESPAAKARLHEGDVVQEVNKQPVKSAKDLVAMSRKLEPNEKILMRVYSQGRSSFVTLHKHFASRARVASELTPLHKGCCRIKEPAGAYARAPPEKPWSQSSENRKRL
jgi:C-terminal processing protease CtpA/Prc